MQFSIAKFFLAVAGFFVLLIIATIIMANAKKQLLFDKAMSELQKSLNADVKGDLSVSVFKHFPKVSIMLADVEISDKESSMDQFANVEELTFKVLPWSLLSNSFDLSEIDIENGFINVIRDNDNKWNLSIFNAGSGSASQDLWKIKDALLYNVQLRYQIDGKEGSEIIYLVESGKIEGNIQSDHSEISALLKGKFQNLPLQFDGLEQKISKIDLHLIGKNDFESLIIKNSKLSIEGNDFVFDGHFAERDSNFLDIGLTGKKIEDLLGLIAGNKFENLKKFEGKADYKFSLNAKKFTSIANANWKIKADVKSNKITNSSIDQRLNNLNIDAIAGLHNSEKDSNFLHIRSFEVSDRKNKLLADFRMSPFKNPSFKVKLTGNASLEKLEAYVPDSLLSHLSGTLKFEDLHFSGSSKDFENIKDSNLKLKGSVNLDDIGITYNNTEYDKINGTLNFQGQEISASDFMIQFLETDIEFNGQLGNLLEYILNLTQNKGSKGTPLIAKGSIKSQQFNLGAIVNGFGSSGSKKSPAGKSIDQPTYSVALEQVLNMDGELKTQINTLVFDKLELENVQADLKLNSGSIGITKLVCGGMDGNISSKGLLKVSDKNTITLDLTSKIAEIDIKELFRQCNNFGQDVLRNDHVDGKLSADVSFSSKWKNITQFQEDALTASADILIEEGNLKGFEPLNALSKHISLEELKNIRFASVTNKIQIENREILIPEMEILSNVIKIEMSGMHNFDNIVDYRFKLNLKSLLAKKFNKKKPRDAISEPLPEGGLNLFIRMAGDMNDPKITFDKEGRKEKIKEDFKKQKEDLKEIFHEEEKKKPEEIEKSKFKIEKKPEYIIWDDEDSTDADRYR